MRITDITVVLHERRPTTPASFGPARPGPLGALRVQTDEGIEGNASLSSPGPGPAQIADQIVTVIKPWLTAADPLDIIKGGITGLMKIARLAEAFGMNCEVHDSYNALNNFAARHVMMAIDNCDWLEVLAFNRSGDHSLAHFSYGLTEPFRVDPNGDVHAPTGPGIGADIDWDLINSSVQAIAS